MRVGWVEGGETEIKRGQNVKVIAWTERPDRLTRAEIDMMLFFTFMK